MKGHSSETNILMICWPLPVIFEPLSERDGFEFQGHPDQVPVSWDGEYSSVVARPGGNSKRNLAESYLLDQIN